MTGTEILPTPHAAGRTGRAGESGLRALATLLRLHDIATDDGALRQRFGLLNRELTALELLRAARRLGLRARETRADWPRLARLALPAIAQDGDGAWFVIGRVDATRAIVQDVDGRVCALSREELEARWTGRLILATSRSGAAGPVPRFDLSWFIPPLVKHRRLLGEVLLASLFLQVLALATPLFFQVVVDKVLAHRGFATLDVLVLGFAAALLFEAVLSGLRSYTFSHTTSRVDVELGARLMEHALALPLAYHQARRVGDTVARVRELENVRTFLTGSTLTAVLDLAFAAVFLLVMWIYSPTLTAIAALTIPFYALISLAVTPSLRRRLDEKFDRGAENHAFLTETVAGVETLKAMAVETRVQRQWEDQLAAYVGAAFRAANFANWAGQAIQVVNKLGMVAVLWFGARLVIEGQLTVGELVAFNMLAGRLAAPVLRLAQLWQDLQQFRISVARLGDVLNAPAETAAGAGRGTLTALRGRVTFDRVTFRYRQDGRPVISELSLDVPPGQVLGIVGPSGSGKSTLTRLLQRLHVPEAGRVMVDGVDLALVDPQWLRGQIGIVLQESVLFNRSIRDNIALADPGLSQAAVIQAAQLAGAHDFILELPLGYDTVIGERGSTLSGGQRQRIAIARALIIDPRILILDEATSALDYESERIVQENMRAIGAGRTVIVIAHRLATVRAADRIVTIEDGRITEDGTHEELLARGGRYAALHRHQTAASTARPLRGLRAAPPPGVSS